MKRIDECEPQGRAAEFTGPQEGDRRGCLLSTTQKDEVLPRVPRRWPTAPAPRPVTSHLRPLRPGVNGAVQIARAGNNTPEPAARGGAAALHLYFERSPKAGPGGAAVACALSQR